MGLGQESFPTPPPHPGPWMGLGGSSSHLLKSQGFGRLPLHLLLGLQYHPSPPAPAQPQPPIQAGSSPTVTGGLPEASSCPLEAEVPVPIEGPPSFPHGPGGRGEGRGWCQLCLTLATPLLLAPGKGGTVPAPTPGLGEGWLSNQDPGALGDCGGGRVGGPVSSLYISSRGQRQKKKKKRVCLCLAANKNPMGSPIAGPTHLPAPGGDVRPERRSHRPSAPAGLQRGKARSSHLQPWRGPGAALEAPASQKFPSASKASSTPACSRGAQAHAPLKSGPAPPPPRSFLG